MRKLVFHVSDVHDAHFYGDGCTTMPPRVGSDAKESVQALGHKQNGDDVLGRHRIDAYIDDRGAPPCPCGFLNDLMGNVAAFWHWY